MSTTLKSITDEPAGSPARNYLFIGGMALLVIAAVMFVRSSGSLPAALLPTVVAAAGLILRWRIAPGLALLLLVYLVVLPYGIPMGGSSLSDVLGSGFRILDLVLVAATIIYFGCQFRLISLKDRAMPSDRITGGEKTPTVRPTSLVRAEEYSRLFQTVAGAVFAGQFLWILIASVRVRFESVPPFQLRGDVFATSLRSLRDYSDSPTSRFLVLLGLFGIAAILLGSVFWYWRLAKLSRSEAAMILLDTGWRENRRELNRQEKWRGWAVRRDRKARGLLHESPKAKGASLWGCFQLALFAILGPIALFLMIRMAWPLIVP